MSNAELLARELLKLKPSSRLARFVLETERPFTEPKRRTRASREKTAAEILSEKL